MNQKSKKTSKLSVNFAYQSTYQILTIILPLITAPYISRVLGAENTGIFSYTYAITNYFLIFAALGIESYGNRCIARAKSESQEAVNRTFSGIFAVHTITSVIATVGYVGYVFGFEKQYQMIALLQIFWIISEIFNVNWFFFGIEEFKLTVTRNIIIKLLSVAAIFLFVHSEDDLWLYTLIMSGSMLLSQAVMWLFLLRYVSFVKVSTAEIKKHVRPLFVLFVAVVATTLYRMIDKVMLGIAGDMSIVGAYEYADKIIRIPVALITALGTVMLPRMSSLYVERKTKQIKEYMRLSVRLIFILSFAMAFGLAGIAREFIPFFLGPGYEPAISIIHILAISIPFMGWNNLIRTQILMPTMKDKIYTRAVWMGAIVDVILNAVLIYFFSANGAAMATVVAYAVVSVFQVYPIRKEISVMQHLSAAIVPCFAGVLMLGIVRFIGDFGGASIGTIIAQIGFGGIAYAAICIVYLYKVEKETVINFLTRRLRHN